MGVFLATAAYNYQPDVSALPPRTAGYTYYRMRSERDVTIPTWLIRVNNTVTSSIGVNQYVYCSNAQYASNNYGGLQASPMSNRWVSGSSPQPATSYGFGGIVVGIDTGSSPYFTDSFEYSTCQSGYLYTASLCNCNYGTNAASVGWLTRDHAGYIASNNNFGYQPWIGTCATYTNTALTPSHAYISCSNNTTYTSSIAETVCAREWRWTTLGSSTTLTITGYYSGSCGTY